MAILNTNFCDVWPIAYYYQLINNEPRLTNIFNVQTVKFSNKKS
jgi:hypothetical protein